MGGSLRWGVYKLGGLRFDEVFQSPKIVEKKIEHPIKSDVLKLGTKKKSYLVCITYV